MFKSFESVRLSRNEYEHMLRDNITIAAALDSIRVIAESDSSYLSSKDVRRALGIAGYEVKITEED